MLDEIASAQVQMCEALEASLVVSLESFADLEMKQVSQLKSDAEQITESAEASFAKYMNGRHSQGLSSGMDSWNKVSESVTSQIGPTIQQWKAGKFAHFSSIAVSSNAKGIVQDAKFFQIQEK